MLSDNDLSMLEFWSPIVQAAGLFRRDMTPDDVFFLAGDVCSYPLVAERHLARLNAWQPSGDELYAPSFDFYVEIFKSMTREEKAALKAAFKPATKRRKVC